MPFGEGGVEEIRAAGHPAIEAAARQHVDELLSAAFVLRATSAGIESSSSAAAPAPFESP
jgi:hypothetical protein